MITYVVGNLFASPAKVLVNTVNTVGAMGKGIALDFKRVYPEMFEKYQYFCENGMFEIGKLWLYKTSHKWILNFPTKKHWRHKSKPEYIEAGLRKFVDTYDSKGIVSISFPLLGCGNGELDWSDTVQPLMEEYLGALPIDVYIHLYSTDERFVAEHRNIREVKKWLRSDARNLPFVEFWDDLKQLLYSRETFDSMNNARTFTASLDLFEENLEFAWDSRTFSVHKESFERIWASARPTGFILASDFPIELSNNVEPIFSLLQLLDYIEPVRLSARSIMTDHDFGLLLLAQPSEIQSEQQMVLSA